jgi:hypothetical protein
VLSSTVAPEAPRGLRDALARAVACVLRWQEPDGSWAIHRYNPAGPPWSMPPRTLSVMYAVEALAGSAPHIGADFGDAPRRALDFVRRHARRDGGGVFWHLDFLDRPSPHGGDDVDDLLLGAVDYLRATWTPDPAAALLISFRVPTWRGPALDRFQWELPLDPIVVSALLRDPRATERLSDAQRAAVAASVAAILGGCHSGGFWVDILKAQEGQVQGMTGNSDFFQTALMDYARDQSRFCAERDF